MRDTMRPLSQGERDESIKLVYDYVISRLGIQYLWNLEVVVKEMTLFCITKTSPDPGPVLNYWDRKVRVLSEMVAEYLINEYRGVAEFGMLTRARHLYTLARSSL